MVLEKRIKKIERRMKFLFDNQPHEHEWDCRIEQAEYFMLSTLLETISEHDGIIEPISVEDVNIALQNINKIML